jgi:endonuclease G
MKLTRQLIDKAAQRAVQTAHDLDHLREKRRAQRPIDLETKDRLAARKRFVAEAAATPAEAAGVFERIIKGNDLMSINYLEKGARVAKSVGRVHVRDAQGEPLQFGTGFLIAPAMLLTNHHVLPDRETAASSLVEFDYELDAGGRDRQSYTFSLRPEEFFFAHEKLDFAVVAVAPTAREQSRPIGDFAWIKLLRESGKALLAEYLTIIQHPGGQRKQICVRENQLIKLDTDTIWYATDTLGGSSGSPAFNTSWQVVALHHLGVPKKNAAGQWLTVDGQIWDPSMDENRVQWIANEGIRISRIVDTLAKKHRKHPRLAALFDASQPPAPRGFESANSAALPDTAAHHSSNGAAATSHADTDFNLRTASGISIPVRVSVALGADAGAAANGARTEALSIDPDYSSRRGFDPAFLGKTAALKTPLPTLNAKQKAVAAKLLAPGAGANDPFELKYHHFSIVMNARRRLAFFTAVNIDGLAWRDLTRATDRWILDPRIATTAQTGEALYANNPLDRGHLVRRRDPVWGPSLAVAKAGNDDTFHFTNCAPQHAHFNQNPNTWAGLEDYILRNADRENLRVNVYTGPVFATSDDTYRGIQLPRQFWKVVVMIFKKKLHATGYLLSQAKLIQGLIEADFRYSAYKTFQVPVAKIAQLTGLGFGPLINADPLDAPLETTTGALREISTFDDVKL